jgi:hypothetical protein
MTWCGRGLKRKTCKWTYGDSPSEGYSHFVLLDSPLKKQSFTELQKFSVSLSAIDSVLLILYHYFLPARESFMSRTLYLPKKTIINSLRIGTSFRNYYKFLHPSEIFINSLRIGTSFRNYYKFFSNRNTTHLSHNFLFFEYVSPDHFYALHVPSMEPITRSCCIFACVTVHRIKLLIIYGNAIRVHDYWVKSLQIFDLQGRC